MAKLLDVIVSQLRIRVDEKENSDKEVPSEVMELFKKEFNHHLYRKLKTIKVGEYVDYMFECGYSRPLGTIVYNANDNLAEVLKKLPKLPEGESYAFPPNSYIAFTLTGKYNKQFKIEINLVTDVFIKAGL